MARKKKADSALLTALLYIIVGVLLVAFPGTALQWAIYIIGGVFLLLGILDVCRKNFVSGAVSLIIGLAVILLGGFLLDIVLLVLGVLIAIKGLVALIEVLKRKKKTFLQVLFPILTMIIGVFIAFGNFESIVLMVGGILLVIDGVIGLIACLKR